MSIPRDAASTRKVEYIHEEPQTLPNILAELTGDLKEFVQTRFQLLLAELRAKIAAWKSGVLTLAIAFVFAMSAFLLLTGALVAILAAMLGVFLGLLIVGVLYLVIAGWTGLRGYRKLTSQRVPPERTLQLLKEDRLWIRNQAKSE